jgi:hypothetical protein
LPPCLGLSEFPLDSSGPHKSWGSSVPGIWNADSAELMRDMASCPRRYLQKAAGAATQ